MTANKYTASLRGRNNRNTGELFEDIIIPDIEKTPEPFKITSKASNNGRFTGFFEKQAQPDFKGTLKGGRSIVFDAKATMTDRIPLSALSDEQKKHLQLHHALGAVSGVMISYSFNGFYFLCIDTFLNAKTINGHMYWLEEETQEHGIKLKLSAILDFLNEDVLTLWTKK